MTLLPMSLHHGRLPGSSWGSTLRLSSCSLAKSSSTAPVAPASTSAYIVGGWPFRRPVPVG